MAKEKVLTPEKEAKKAMKKAERKEKWRKFIVSLKKRPHNIPLVFMLVTYVFYSLNLTKISNTTAFINVNPMGLCTFIVMLFSILAIVSFLNAYPKRQKPKIAMVVVMFAIIACCIVADLIYLIKLNARIKELYPTAEAVANFFSKKKDIPQARVVIVVHLICEFISVGLICSINALGKAFNKIDTSVKLADNDIGNIELSE